MTSRHRLILAWARTTASAWDVLAIAAAHCPIQAHPVPEGKSAGTAGWIDGRPASGLLDLDGIYAKPIAKRIVELFPRLREAGMEKIEKSLDRVHLHARF